MHLTIQTCGTRHRDPKRIPNVDLLLDCRPFPNPHGLGHCNETGLDPKVISWLNINIASNVTASNRLSMLRRRIEKLKSSIQHDPTIVFFCIGGRHRSVYLAERLATELRSAGDTVVVQHLELPNPTKEPKP